MADPEPDIDKPDLTLTEKLASIGRLAAGIAHELNGPLQAIVTLAEILGRDPERSDRIEAANRILRSALRCRGMVQDLLSFARKPPHRLTAVDVSSALMDALELDRYSDVGEVQVQIEDTRRVPRVLAEAQRLTQVFLNLITNARQATRASGQPGLVKVSLSVLPRPADSRVVSKADSIVRFSVTDQGPGVPPELRTRIFEPFMTTKAEGEGTGLGLAISRDLVEDIGGELYLDASFAPGARFVVDLPVREESAQLAESPDQPAMAQEGCTILVIDDDREVLETYEAILSLDNHRVRTTDRAEKALAILKEERFDAILCDMRLPDIPGDQFLARLRILAPEMVDRVIFATGDVVSDSTHAFLSAIPNPALLKPFRAEDLARAISTVTRRSC